MLFNLIGWRKGTGRKIALFIPAATEIIFVAVFAYTSWYKGGYNGLIRVLFSRAVTLYKAFNCFIIFAAGFIACFAFRKAIILLSVGTGLIPV